MGNGREWGKGSNCDQITNHAISQVRQLRLDNLLLLLLLGLKQSLVAA